MKPVLNSFLCIFMCFQLLACGVASTDETVTVEMMTVAVLAGQIEQGTPPLILDVRSPKEYAAGHIPGAINIEYRQVSEQIETIQAYEARDIVVYCERGVRANRAIAALVEVGETAGAEAGFSKVLFLEGHMRAWRRANLPIEKPDDSKKLTAGKTNS